MSYLGIEIGGTKLQLGVGDGSGGELAALVRRDVDRQRGASGILDEIARSAQPLIHEHRIDRIGIGFGGPVSSATGRTTKSHQVEGWEDFPLVDWCQQNLGKPATIGNDCDVAALAEANYGAGRGAYSVFYVTVGTGIGGGLVLGGKLHGAGRPAAAEIGHLRPGLEFTDPDWTVESRASGPAIAKAAAAFMEDPENVTARVVAESYAAGNVLAGAVVLRACETLGWAVAQAITLIGPEIVVVGGGVSLIGEELFFEPLRKYVAQFVFPPLHGSYKIVPAGLGELAVVHGAIALAAGER
jgi:glucokinase